LKTLSPQEARICDLAEPLAHELGLEIVRIRVSGGKRPQLQIMIERAGGKGTDVEDCATFFRLFSPILEVEDPIEEAYRLEISTPGIDRPLTRPGDFAQWAGHLAKIELSLPIQGRRRFRGLIVGEDEKGVTLALDDETELIARIDEMSKASLVLTDELIDQASETGDLPPQPGDEDFTGYETDSEADEDPEDTMEERINPS